MTPAQLGLAVGLSAEQALRWHPHIKASSEKYDFASPKRMAMWLAQCAHESQRFRRFTENLNYSAMALRVNWPKHFPTAAIAEQYARQPEKIANRAYADRMGNGPEESGDGWRFRGKGAIQVTGRSNHRACGRSLGVDLENEPDRLLQDEYAIASAGWYWVVRGLGVLADRGDIVGVTKLINGGTNGLTERRALYTKALAVLEGRA